MVTLVLFYFKMPTRYLSRDVKQANGKVWNCEVRTRDRYSGIIYVSIMVFKAMTLNEIAQK